MVLTRWNPWQELFDMERQMTQLLKNTLGTTFTGARTQTWAPAIDVFVREGDLVVRAELPGINPENDVDIFVQEGALTIRGERRHEETHNGGTGYSRYESAYGSFSRTVPLPQGVDADSITATYENGILEVVVPKVAELTAAKKVPITVGQGQKALTTRGRKTK